MSTNIFRSGVTLIEGGSLFLISFLTDVGLNPNDIQADDFLAAIAQILVILYTILKLYKEGGKKITWQIIEKLFEIVKIIWKIARLPLKKKKEKTNNEKIPVEIEEEEK